MLRSNVAMRMVSAKDVSGRVVFDIVLESEEYQMDISSLNSGIYLVEVTTSEGISVLKLQVSK